MEDPHRAGSGTKSRKRKRGDRGFDEIPLQAAGVQSGLQDRYNEETRADVPFPTLNIWRMNLTALSHAYNLYFVASEATLLVFQPIFPNQTASPRSACQITLPKTRANAPGAVDPNEPHSVNNMIVAELGTEEMVLCACDDGDVIGYWTKDIWIWVLEVSKERQKQHRETAAARKAESVRRERSTREDVEEAARRTRIAAEREMALRAAETPIRPAFHKEIGKSAWGLAIHKEARLVAASSNTHDITVWAPALTDPKAVSKIDQDLDHAIANERTRNNEVCAECRKKQRHIDIGVVRYSLLLPREADRHVSDEESVGNMDANDHNEDATESEDEFANPEDPWSIGDMIPISFHPQNTADPSTSFPEIPTRKALVEHMSLCLDWEVKTMLSAGRAEEQTRTLRGHEHHIPAIAFCNTAEDEDGRYLAATDLAGGTVIWDVERGIPARIARAPLLDLDSERWGWGILFLDKRSFSPTRSIVEAMGTCASVTGYIQTAACNVAPEEEVQVQGRRLTLYDISGSQSMVKRTDRWTIGDIEPEAPVSNVQEVAEEEEANNTSRSEVLTDQPPIGSPSTADSTLQQGSPSPSPSLPDTEVSVRPALSAQSMATYRNNMAGKIPHIETEAPPLDIPEIRAYPDLQKLMMHRFRWALFNFDSLHTSHIMCPRAGSIFIPSEEEMPDSPVMLVNPDMIHLFQSPSLLNPPNGQPGMTRDMPERRRIALGVSSPAKVNGPRGEDPLPTIYIESPLAQDVAPHVDQALHTHDRMDKILQIPELGVVLAGSPKGRVAVLTLHKLIPDPLKRLNKIEDATYAMRLDHILPFDDQEQRRQRPPQILVGVSAGPVFGGLGRKIDGRWRILLMYRDNTMMAYEISRPETDPMRDPYTGVRVHG